jgi:MFS transporter, FHS family, glucose/mannose:H+ symporter
MFVFGVVLALLGTLFGLPQMRARMGVGLSQQGDLFFLLFFGVCVTTLAAGPLMDRWGSKLVLVWSMLLVATGLAGFAIVRSMGTAALAALLTGFGGGGLNTSSNALVSEVYAHNRGPMLNLLGMFYATGGLFVPVLVASMSANVSTAGLLLVTAALPLFAAGVYSTLGFPPPREAHGISRSEVVQVARYPGLALFACILFVEAGNEAALGGWASTYLGALGVSARTATWVLAGFWAALIVGRLLAFKIVFHLPKESLVLSSAAASAASCILLVTARTPGLTAVAVVLAAFAFASIYPTVIAMAGDRYSKYAGTMFGLLFAVGLAGGGVFPWGVGQVSQAINLRAGMLVLLGGTFATTMLAAMIRRTSATPPSGRQLPQ